VGESVSVFEFEFEFVRGKRAACAARVFGTRYEHEHE